MDEQQLTGAEVALDHFVEGLFRLIIERHQRNVAQMELTLTQAEALALLYQAPLSTTKLSARLRISAPAVSQLTDRLARKDLIERRAVETDRRSILVGLTKRGAQIIESFRQQRYEAFGEALSRVSEAERLDITRALGKIAAVLGDYKADRQGSPQKPANRLRRRPPAQTAIEPARTSNGIGNTELIQPPRRRMKIEWD